MEKQEIAGLKRRCKELEAILDAVPAWVFLVIWFVFQFLWSASQAGVHADAGGVAYGAHIGGFITGVLLTWIIPRRSRFLDRSSEDETFSNQRF